MMLNKMIKVDLLAQPKGQFKVQNENPPRAATRRVFNIFRCWKTCSLQKVVTSKNVTCNRCNVNAVFCRLILAYEEVANKFAAIIPNGTARTITGLATGEKPGHEEARARAARSPVLHNGSNTPAYANDG